MPRSARHKAQTRARIIEAAARAFRERGVGQVGIADIMRDAGLTHGGFYAHFPNKDALVAEAAMRGLDDSRRAFVAAAAAANPDAPLREVIRRYVSRSHRDFPADGCATPALAAEIAREPDEVRTAFTEGLDEFVVALMDYLPGETPEARRDAALVLVASMSGAVALSRAINDPIVSDRVLLATRRFLWETLAEDTQAASPPAGGAPPAIPS
jgi:TetR/AcrR family transcriptional regulator, transcriptional repressor for nem operon